MYCVDLGECFHKSIYSQNSVSTQPRTSLSKFGGDLFHFFNSLLIEAPQRVYVHELRALFEVQHQGYERAQPRQALEPVHLGELSAESGQTLQASFSDVWKPKFASKYSLE